MRALATPLCLALLYGCSGESGIGVPAAGPFQGTTSPEACASTPIFMLGSDPSTGKPLLSSFDPSSATVSKLGPLVFSKQGLFAAGSIAVDRAGQVYALANLPCGEGWIFRCDTTSLKCEPTAAAQSRSGMPAAGSACVVSMAFTADAASPTGESMFFLEQILMGRDAGPELGRVDATTSGLIDVAPITGTPVGGVTFAGSADGGLFAAFEQHPNLGVGTDVDTVDVKTGASAFSFQVAEVPANGEQNLPAVARRGGDFYFFVQDPTTRQITITRFRSSDFSVTQVATTSGFTLESVASSSCE